MEDEPPTSYRRLAVKIACMLVGMVLLYVLGVGPVVFLSQVYERERIGMAVCEPLYMLSAGTPLDTPLKNYVGWWVERAWERRLGNPDWGPE